MKRYLLSHNMTGSDARIDWTRYTRRPIRVQKGSRKLFRQPDASGRMPPDTPWRPINPSLRAAPLGA
jgi:hypothetical protein